MWVADTWQDYEILDTAAGEKLERWGSYILVRPDPQVIWDFGHGHPGWKQKNAHYHRSSKGGGEWEFIDLPKEWTIRYGLSADRQLIFHLKPFSFKHTGLFPEQAVNWEWFMPLIVAETARRKHAAGSSPVQGGHNADSSGTDPVRVLNLFAYTGGATIAAASAGAFVTHVDASRGMVSWAKENARSSALPETSVRWLVDDCKKFVEREIRRGNHYDAVIMDPPSYGRGPKGEIWKIEDELHTLVHESVKLLTDRPLFFLINSYTTGFAPGVLSYILEQEMKPFGGRVSAGEIGLPVTSTGSVLPCGSSGRWEADR